jgi:hypothetical protein
VGLNTYHRYATLKTAHDRFVVTPNNVTIDAYASYDVRQEPLVVVAPVLERPRWYIVQIGDSFDEIVQDLGGYSRATARDLPADRPGFSRRHTGRNGPHRQPHLTRTPRHADFRQWRGRSSCGCRAAEGLSGHSAECLLRDGLTTRPPQATVPAAFTSNASAPLRFYAELGYAMQQRLSVSIGRENSVVIALWQIGLSAAGGFDWRALDDATHRGLERALSAGEKIADDRWEATGKVVNGWRYTMSGGRAGQDFALRATLAKYQLGAQLADEVLYPNTKVDDRGEALMGSQRYELNFPKGPLPPLATF